MAKFEEFKPQLKPGQITPQGEKLIYETEDPGDQIVLPIETADFLVLCNGEYSIGEIIEKLYHRKAGVQFKSLFKTLIYLKKRGFLENGSDLDINNPNDEEMEKNLLTVKPLFEISIGKRIFSEKERPLLFYICSMVTVVLSILSFQHFSKNWLSLDFLKIENSYATGIAFLFIFSSLLLSIKNFFKCLLLLFLTGRAYNFNLVFNGFALYFRVKSDSLFLVSQRLYIFLFYMASLLCYFPIISALYFFFPSIPYYNQVMSLGLLLLLIELNPFQESESTYFIKTMFNDDTLNKLSRYQKEKSLISLIDPNERRRDYGLFLVFAQFVLLWSVTILFVAGGALFNHFQPMIDTIKSADVTEKLATLGALSYLITMFVIVSYNSAKTLYLSLYVPISNLIQKRKRQVKSQTLSHFSESEVIDIISDLPLFGYFSTDTLIQIIKRSELKEYNSGAPIISEGDPASHLFVLLAGRLRTRKRFTNGRVNNISNILPTSIFGESAVIDESKRSADVIAIDRSIVLEVPAAILKQIATDTQYIRELEAFKNAIIVNQFFSSAPIFRDLSENIVQMFIFKGKIESFVNQQVIFKQGDIGDGFYLMLRGSVGVSVNGKDVARIQQGGFFGEIAMIADVPRTATIYALEPVQTLKISRDAFWEILSHDINMAMFIESVGEMRISEDIEIIKSA